MIAEDVPEVAAAEPAERAELVAVAASVLGRGHEVARAVHDGDEAALDGLWDDCVEVGIPAMLVPADLGGLGLGPVELTLVAEELGRACAPGILLSTFGQFVPLLRACGTPEAAKFLTAAATGMRATVACVGPDGDPDPSTTSATVSVAADGYALDGTADYVLDLDRADELAVIARAADGQLMVLVVPTATVDRQVRPGIDPLRRHGAVTFSSVTVPSDRVVGRMSDEEMEHAAELMWLAQAAVLVGTSRAIFTMTLDYAKERRQFGAPIGSFQALKHRFVEWFVAQQRARALTRATADDMVRGLPSRHTAVSMAKAAAGDCQELAVREGLQLHGAIGMTWEHDLHLLQRRARVDEATFGSAAWHRRRLARLMAPRSST